MTISELAKIALEEKRVVNVRREAWAGKIFGCQELDPGHWVSLRFMTCEALVADDWYEVKE